MSEQKVVIRDQESGRYYRRKWTDAEIREMSGLDVGIGKKFSEAVLASWQESTRKPSWQDHQIDTLDFLRQCLLEDALMLGKSGKVLTSMQCLIEALYQRLGKDPLIEKAMRTLEDLPVSLFATVAIESLQLVPRLDELLLDRDIGDILDALARPALEPLEAET